MPARVKATVLDQDTNSLTISMTRVALRKPDTGSRPPNTKELETTLTALKVKRVPSGYMHHTSPVCHHSKGHKKTWRAEGGGGTTLRTRNNVPSYPTTPMLIQCCHICHLQRKTKSISVQGTNFCM